MGLPFDKENEPLRRAQCFRRLLQVGSGRVGWNQVQGLVSEIHRFQIRIGVTANDKTIGQTTRFNRGCNDLDSSGCRPTRMLLPKQVCG